MRRRGSSGTDAARTAKVVPSRYVRGSCCHLCGDFYAPGLKGLSTASYVFPGQA